MNNILYYAIRLFTILMAVSISSVYSSPNSIQNYTAIEDSIGKPDMILQYYPSNPHADKKSHLRKKRVQLWTDNTYSEFAIIHDSRILMETKKDSTYSMLIDELNCLEEFDYDWDYMLSQWVPLYFSNKYLKKVPDPTEASQKLKTVGSIENGSTVFGFKEPEVMRRLKPKSRPKSRPESKPGLKCHFCNLKYSLEEERKEHEEFWHRNL